MVVAICDDEKIFREQVVECLNAYNNEICIYEYDDGCGLIDSKKEYDIIFLDIEMPGINGMEVAESLRENNVDSLIIFLTSHSEYVYDAFKVNAFRFLKKPIEMNTFIEAMQTAEKEISDIEKILVNYRGVVCEVSMKDIVYIETYGEGTYIYDKHNNVYESQMPLKEWEIRLKHRSEFFRIHRTYMVSMLYINNINGNTLELLNSKYNLNVSRRKMSAFKETYMKFIKNNARLI